MKPHIVVVSTKGTSAGSVAGDGLMASFGRAPMLSADYSLYKLVNDEILTIRILTKSGTFRRPIELE